MTGYLLDTNVVSELVKAKPEPLVKAFIASCSLDELYLTEITFAEIRFGIEKQPDPLKPSWLQDSLNNELRPMFERRVLTIDEEVILR